MRKIYLKKKDLFECFLPDFHKIYLFEKPSCFRLKMQKKKNL